MLHADRQACDNTVDGNAGGGLLAMLQEAAVLRLHPRPQGKAPVQLRRRHSASQGGGANPSRKSPLDAIQI